jgi:hypothetical protein
MRFLDPFKKLAHEPTIGGIAFARNGERNNKEATGMTHNEFAVHIWKKYDEHFISREDYQLYRMLVWKDYPPLELPDFGQLDHVIQEGLKSPLVKVRWGVLAVLAYVADGCTPNELEKLQVLSLGTDNLRALVLRLPPLPNSELACEAVRQVCLRLIFKAAERWPQVEADTLEKALDWCVEWLPQFDQHWKLGNRIKCSFEDADVLAVGKDVVLEGFVLTVLTSCLRQVTNGLEAASHFKKTERVAALTQKAYFLASNVWDTARHRLRGELCFRDDKKGRPGSIRLANVSDKHGVVLRVLVRLASYCGEHLRCAALAHLYLKTVRDPAVAADFTKHYAWRIRQAGLQIDERRNDEDEKNRVRPARLPRTFDP